MQIAGAGRGLDALPVERTRIFRAAQADFECLSALKVRCTVLRMRRDQLPKLGDGLLQITGIRVSRAKP